MLSTLFSNPLVFILWAAGLIIAITVHEFAHAYAADRLGDPTPRIAGRLSLDPRAHLDPLGTAMLLLIGFGWGRPVVFDPYNLRNPRRDAAIISLAGPVSNIIFASILSLIIHTMAIPSLVEAVLSLTIGLNLTLAIFNLVPVYPLDGEKILAALLPSEMAREYQVIMRQYGTIILLFLILPLNGTSAISALISPVISALSNILL